MGEQPDPIALVRRVRIRGRVCFRAVTYARQSAGRQLIGYYPDGDSAAEAAWRHYCDERTARHEVAARSHGRPRHHGPAMGA